VKAKALGFGTGGRRQMLSCFTEPHKPFVRRFLRKVDTRTHANDLREDMVKASLELAEFARERLR